MTPPRRHSGFIVLIVMVVIVMLALAGLTFVLNLSLENKAVRLQGDQQQLRQTMASGVELMRGFLAQSPAERQQAGGTQQNAGVFAAVALASDGTPSGDTRFSIVSPSDEGEMSSGLRFGLQNESARIHLGVLAEWEAAEPGSARDALMHLPGMSEPVAEAILDWLDGDDLARPAGAEADYYIGRGLPYEPRNHVPAALDELLLVRDVSRISLFGGDANANYRIDPGEESRAGAAAADAASGQTPWARMLTLYSAEANRTFEGAPRIYLNQDDLGTLHQQLTEALDPKAADFVVAYRQFGEYDPSVPPTPRRAASPPESNPASRRSTRPSSRTAPESPLDLSQPPAYQIASILDLIEARVVRPPEEGMASDLDEGESESVESSSRDVENPFDEHRDRLRDYLPQWYELTTVTDSPVLRGRINILEASRPVLLSVPGLDESLADQILSARGGAADGARLEYRHPVWLLTEGLVDRQQMRQLESYVTCGGDVFRAQVAAFDVRSGLVARAEVVLDASVSPPRQLYCKDLGLLGRGFTNQELGAESGELGAEIPE